MKSGHGFGDHTQDGELARWGLGRDTKWRSYYAQTRLRNAKPGNYLKVLPNNRVAKIFIVCLHYEISFFGIFHRFTHTIAIKKTFSSLLNSCGFDKPITCIDRPITGMLKDVWDIHKRKILSWANYCALNVNWKRPEISFRFWLRFNPALGFIFFLAPCFTTHLYLLYPGKRKKGKYTKGRIHTQ